LSIAGVHRAVEILRGRTRYLPALTPEGTRRRTERSPTGFCHIARSAGVPVVPVAFDYERRECRIGPAIEMTDDAETDLEMLRWFYAGVTAKQPARFGPTRFGADQPSTMQPEGQAVRPNTVKTTSNAPASTTSPANPQ
jgi:hypothetical protein